VDLGRELLHRFKTLRAISACDPAEVRGIKRLRTAEIAQIKAAHDGTSFLKAKYAARDSAVLGDVKGQSDNNISIDIRAADLSSG
jgi:DNA repair protein RadC